MLINYIKISFRHLLKHKLYLLINVFGLALGFSSFILISEYVLFERSYDTHFSNSSQIYRVTTDQVINGEIVVRDAMSFYPSGAALKAELPEVIDYTSTYKFNPLVFRKNKNHLVEEKSVLAVDHNFLNIFDYEILYGNLSKIAQPNQLIITRSKALEYFGDVNVVNESILVHSEFDQIFNIAAVIEDIPVTTHYKFDILMSVSSIQQRLDNDSWSNYSYYTYLYLREGTDIKSLRPLLSNLSKKYIGEHTKLTFNLQPIKEIHLSSGFTYEPEIHGNSKSVRILSFLAWFIIFIAWINYINLATAKAINRTKEIGVRKSLGAYRFQLVTQFFTEASLVNLLAAICTYLLIQFLVPSFNELVGKEILTNMWGYNRSIQFMIVFFLLGTFSSGLYPALLMSGFSPLKALSGKFRDSKKGGLLRKGLMTFQYSISFILITCTLVIISQVEYMSKIDKGMNTEQIIGVPLPPQPVDTWKSALSRLENLSNQLTRNSTINGTAVITNLPGGGSSDINASGGLEVIGVSEFNESIFYSIGIDEHVLPLLGMELLFGRNFREGFVSDDDAVIVNQSFIKKLGLPFTKEILGKKIRYGRNEANQQYEIIGVVKDANRTSSHIAVEPTVYFSDWGYGGGHGYGSLMIKISQENIRETIDLIHQQWKSFFPNEVFNYQFLDDRYALLYENDKKFGNLFGLFSILTIIITILGLIGLVSFLATQRTKEVGIRKVLGASVGQIILLFYTDIIRLIGFSSTVGIFLVWFIMQHWLNQYAYKIGFPWWTILISSILLIIFSFLTVLFQTRKVAFMNPSSTLNAE